MPDYKQLAAQQYDPSYNAKVTALKNELANKLSSYNNQLSQYKDTYNQGVNTTNQNYDKQVDEQNLNNTLTKNNYSNNTLSRGLGRSTIFTTGMAGLDDKNTRLVGNINYNRTNSLNDLLAKYNTGVNEINQSITDAKNATDNTLTTLAGDRESQIMSLAKQLEDSDWEKNYKERTLAMQQRQIDAQRAYYSGRGGGSSSFNPSATGAYNSAVSDIQDLMNSNMPASEKLSAVTREYNNWSAKSGKEANAIASMLKQTMGTLNNTIKGQQAYAASGARYQGIENSGLTKAYNNIQRTPAHNDFMDWLSSAAKDTTNNLLGSFKNIIKKK